MRLLPGLLLLAALALAGCGTEPSTGTASDAAAGTTAGSPVSLDFEGTTLDGQTYDGADLAGAPAVLWFWAPWCPTCLAQIPNVSALAHRYDGEVAVVGVGGLAGAEAIRDTAREIEYVTHLVDEEGAIWRHFGVSAQSTYAVLDADGSLVAEGHLEDSRLNDLVAQLAQG